MMGLAFASPLLLWGLVALPVLWFLLRAVPPAPIRRRFPGVALLLGLVDEDRQADKTPWWLMALRMAAIALVILGFAGPVLNPKPLVASDKPLLILFDGGWAEAPDWSARLDHAVTLLHEAGRTGRKVAVIELADAPQPVLFGTAAAWQGRLAALLPRPWLPENQQRWIADLPEGGFDSVWLTDTLSHTGRPLLATELAKRGALRVVATPRPILALHPAVFADGKVQLTVNRLPAGDAGTVDLVARGPDPSGVEQDLARGTLTFAAAADKGTLAMELPPELRNRVTRFEIAGQNTAGAVSLADDSLKRRKVAIVSDGSDREGLQLLSPSHYLRQALQPTADLLEGGVSDVLPANPDVIILVDVAKLPQTETDGLLDWVKKGGLLVRFAGPKLAASDLGRTQEDPLMPVRLREGGRTVGGAMSWDDPKTLAPFPEGSPFHGLDVPADVTVTSQVLAQPEPELAGRTIAALA
ncbi:MAG: BatA domain-containing protein, partial [Pseudorhodobacter sp.]|nr:BatA domain-containing protein [Pseudorhodobacter sp.]